jgi:hypothetical protein
MTSDGRVEEKSKALAELVESFLRAGRANRGM